MLDSFYIAWRYACFNKGKTIVLIASITLTSFLPLSLQFLLDRSEEALLARAASTPLIVGAKGSALDLVMNTLYFTDEIPEPISMTSVEGLSEADLAIPIPMYVRFRARAYPIVGTTLDYFDARNLRITRGRSLAILGECVLGAQVAADLGLGPGDHLVSSPENLFDIAGVYPLKMRVVGVLNRAFTADDRAVFVDLKTAWVIEGLGHGHEDLAKTEDASLVLERTEKTVTANAKLEQFAEITEANRDTFHFHGNLQRYPITAVIAVPFDAKGGTILRGRYVSTEATEQIVKPGQVIEGLLENIVRVKNMIDAVIVIVAAATVLTMVLVFVLSIRLRRRELETIFKLGSSRMTIVRLIGAEILIIIAASAVACGALLTLVRRFEEPLVRMIILGQ